MDEWGPVMTPMPNNQNDAELREQIREIIGFKSENYVKEIGVTMLNLPADRFEAITDQIMALFAEEMAVATTLQPFEVANLQRLKAYHPSMPEVDVLDWIMGLLPETIPNISYNFYWRLIFKRLGIGFTACYENYMWARDHRSSASRQGYDSESIATFGDVVYGDTILEAAIKLALILIEAGHIKPEREQS